MNHTRNQFFLFLNILCFIFLVYLIYQRIGVNKDKIAILVNDFQYECLVNWKQKVFKRTTVYGLEQLPQNYIIYVDDIYSSNDFDVKYSGCFFDSSSYAYSLEHLKIIHNRMKDRGDNISIYKPFGSDKIYLFSKKINKSK